MTSLRSFALLIAGAAVSAAQFHAGVARVDITPKEALWMAGYAARKHASSGVAQPLWAKAVAIGDARRHRVVIVTMDLLRAPRSITDVAAAECQRRYGLQRSEILFNCSHNHSGPVLWEGDPFAAWAPEEYEKSHVYTTRITAQIVDMIGAALKDMRPARLSHAVGEASIASNRRVATPKGYQIGRNPDGPVDKRVPVIAIHDTQGVLRAALFGYACHNTTIGPSSYDFNGDYAGFAQAEFERAHPGAQAMFVELCGGDQDPYPRGGLDVAATHGKALAGAVDSALQGKRRELRGPVKSAFEMVELAFAPHTREMFEARLNDPLPARVRNAKAMLKAYDDGKPVRSLPYPVQAIRLDKDLAIVALGGEPVIDYALRAKRELPGVILAGYSNSVKCYVPSKRVLAEGGYEAEESMLYYGGPAPFTPAVEDTIFAAIARVLRVVR